MEIVSVLIPNCALGIRKQQSARARGGRGRGRWPTDPITCARPSHVRGRLLLDQQHTQSKAVIHAVIVMQLTLFGQAYC